MKGPDASAAGTPPRLALGWTVRGVRQLMGVGLRSGWVWCRLQMLPHGGPWRGRPLLRRDRRPHLRARGLRPLHLRLARLRRRGRGCPRSRCLEFSCLGFRCRRSHGRGTRSCLRRCRRSPWDRKLARCQPGLGRSRRRRRRDPDGPRLWARPASQAQQIEVVVPHLRSALQDRLRGRLRRRTGRRPSDGPTGPFSRWRWGCTRRLGDVGVHRLGAVRRSGTYRWLEQIQTGVSQIGRAGLRSRKLLHPWSCQHRTLRRGRRLGHRRGRRC